MSSRRVPALLLTVGALGVTLTTALEVVTAPYSPAVTVYPLNGVVHGAKVLAILVLAAGLVGLVRHLEWTGERLAAAAVGIVAVATVLGAVPYSVAEAMLDGDLAPATANARLEEVYAQQSWIGTTASIALPLTVLGLVTLAVVVLRHRVLPIWAPIASLVAIPVAVVAGVLGEAGWVLPHPPAWIFLGLAAYGPALARVTAERPLVHA